MNTCNKCKLLNINNNINKASSLPENLQCLQMHKIQERKVIKMKKIQLSLKKNKNSSNYFKKITIHNQIRV